MAYIPSGFWSRLIARLLGDDNLPNIFDEFFDLVSVNGFECKNFRTADDRTLTAILSKLSGFHT